MFAHTQQGKTVYLFSRIKLTDWMLRMPTAQRTDLIEANCGTTCAYVQKVCYSYNYSVAPTFKLKIALGLDKASQGQIDFRDHVADRDAIDWKYMWKVLGKRLRAEAAAAKAAHSEVTEAQVG
jgi:hypothetical protein